MIQIIIYKQLELNLINKQSKSAHHKCFAKKCLFLLSFSYNKSLVDDTILLKVHQILIKLFEYFLRNTCVKYMKCYFFKSI
jgi:hypothetical protein